MIMRLALIAALFPLVEGFQLAATRPLLQRSAAVVPPRSALAVSMGMPGSTITKRGENSRRALAWAGLRGAGSSLARARARSRPSLFSRF